MTDPVEARLCWIGVEAADERMLADVRAQLERVFELRVRTWRPATRPEGTLDARRGQHSSTRILAWLAEQAPSGPLKVLGLTDVDLFIPVLTFVFGEAQLGGAAAIVSTARLSDGTGPVATRRLVARLAKEAVHELGHTFGLLHCGHAGCAMGRSVNTFEVDAKGSGLCGDCRVLLKDLRRDETHRELESRQGGGT